MDVFFSVMNDAAANNYVQLCGCIFAFMLGMHLGVELLDYTASVFQLSEELPDVFPKGVHHSTRPKGSKFSTSSSIVIIICNFYCKHPS